MLARTAIKTLGDTPTPKRTLFNGVCPFVITAHTLHLKTFGKRLQVETLEDTPAHMSKLLDTHPPPKAPFPMGRIYYASNDRRHHGPITLRRLKCFGNERTHICPQIHAPTPKNTLPSKPRSPKRTPAINPRKPYAAVTIYTSHHALISRSQNIFCNAEFCIAECN